MSHKQAARAKISPAPLAYLNIVISKKSKLVPQYASTNKVYTPQQPSQFRIPQDSAAIKGAQLLPAKIRGC